MPSFGGGITTRGLIDQARSPMKRAIRDFLHRPGELRQDAAYLSNDDGLALSPLQRANG